MLLATISRKKRKNGLYLTEDTFTWFLAFKRLVNKK